MVIRFIARIFNCLLLSVLVTTCAPNPDTLNTPASFLVILGIAQDAGFPQAQCKKSCCSNIWGQSEKYRNASCIALVDLDLNKYWLFDATPDFKQQTRNIESVWEVNLAGIFLTHAHVGHYSGMIHLGREVIGASDLPVYVMTKMKHFLETNGPWDQLVQLNNIKLVLMQPDSSVRITENTRITPFLVPHRDEYSETVGYMIKGQFKKGMYIPDIDKWQKWERDLGDEIKKVDMAFIDGSFFRDGELPGRDMSTIPHPLVTESMELLDHLTLEDKNKVHFIHFNHTNPLLQSDSKEHKMVNERGYKVAKQQSVFPL